MISFISKYKRGIVKALALIFISQLSIFNLTSCSDMLETDSTRQVFDPDLNQKTDSVSFALGIMRGMQQLADQYFFVGEMRGELSTTTTYTDNNLRQLANFTADTSNKYDSAYVYYNVINNCNYYLAHRDTANLYTGSQNVVINEYCAVAAVRAWAYMQLARTYKKVPFFTDPVTEISVVNNNNFPEYDINQIVNILAPSLEELAANHTEAELQVPDYSKSSGVSMGTTNFGQAKSINPKHIFLPFRVVLGDLYLETNQYEKAAQQYFKYINYSDDNHLQPLWETPSVRTMEQMMRQPSDYSAAVNSSYLHTYRGGANVASWSNAFNQSPNPVDAVTYIPMAVNKLNGVTTAIPEAFGYDYYASGNSRLKTLDEIQIEPSTEYYALADTAHYYYRQNTTNTSKIEFAEWAAGDARANVLEQGTGEDSTKVWVQKNRYANILLYRTSTVYMHLAEAFNRMGYPDAAFAVLKDGISTGLESLIDTTTTQTNCYISLPTIEMLRTTVPFLNEENRTKFDVISSYGIHMHGAGVTVGQHTSYQMDAVLAAKFNELAGKLNLDLNNLTKQDTINAMEDIICDEYALEFAFEGTRWYDLMRIAHHKNADATYGATYGTQWLAEKYALRGLDATLKNEDNWYLPFK